MMDLPSPPPSLTVRPLSRGGFALLEALVAMVLLSLTLGCMFAMNTHLLGLLRQGKEGTYATQMVQERAEQMRTALWDEITDSAKLANVLKPATATAANLPGVTETIEIEPLVNPTNLKVRCVRSPTGKITSTGAALTSQPSVKVTFSVQWNSRNRVRSRGMVSVLTNGGI